MHVAAIEIDGKISEALRAKLTDGPQKDLKPLIVDKLAEEAEPGLGTRLRRRRGAVGALAVGDMVDQMRVDPPAHVMLDHEFAGAGKGVDMAQMRLEPEPPGQELLG